MPLIQITLAGQAASPETIQQLQQETTRLMASILHKEAALTVVSVTQLPAGAFSANGQPVAVGASLQAMITAGTNTEADKAAFIFAAKSMLTAPRPARGLASRRRKCPWGAAIGASVVPIYVALLELPAGNWGYDGETQAARQAQRLIGGAA